VLKVVNSCFWGISHSVVQALALLQSDVSFSDNILHHHRQTDG